MRAQVRKAFTLVEILIVVVILGILAAIVVPQFTNATQDSQAGNIQTQLSTINTQIELFRARTGASNAQLEALFDRADPWEIFITGGLMPDTDEPVDGGYLKTPPRNPRFNDRTMATAVLQGQSAPDANGVGGGSDQHGWHYWIDDANNFWVGASWFNELTGKLDLEVP
jgi:general secretion pathway protein G